MLNKALGLDLGTQTLGIAQSDILGFVHGVETFRFPKNQYVLARKHVLEICEKEGIKEIALGLPLHQKGYASEMSNICLKFKEDLLKENPNLVIEMIDERFTSVMANNTISELGLNHQKRKDSVDRIAACYILDTYVSKKERLNGK